MAARFGFGLLEGIMQVDTMRPKVQRWLEHWGREFALHRDCEYLGHCSKNMLQVLIEHKGEMPPRNVGYKPLETDAQAQQVEDVICEIARHAPAMAIVLRGMYCGMGRRYVERWETANLLLSNAGQPVMTVSQYRDTAERGFERVYGMLVGIARAA